MVVPVQMPFVVDSRRRDFYVIEDYRFKGLRLAESVRDGVSSSRFSRALKAFDRSQQRYVSRGFRDIPFNKFLERVRQGPPQLTFLEDVCDFLGWTGSAHPVRGLPSRPLSLRKILGHKKSDDSSLQSSSDYTLKAHQRDQEYLLKCYHNCSNGSGF